MKNPLKIPNIWEKIATVETACHHLLLGEPLSIPCSVARDITVVEMNQLPKKKGLSFVEGQRHMLHDLASIELQAVELGLRTLSEFPAAPREFREQLVGVVLEEVEHLKLCLQNLENLNGQWGDWPVHISLWQAASVQDDLLDRILIVHRYLEGSGLDASDTILRRLSGVDCPYLVQAVQVIAEDEVDHVRFGSRWYKEICHINKIDSDLDFKWRLQRVAAIIPKRLEKINPELRGQVGFSPQEIACLQELREIWFQPRPACYKSPVSLKRQ